MPCPLANSLTKKQAQSISVRPPKPIDPISIARSSPHPGFLVMLIKANEECTLVFARVDAWGRTTGLGAQATV